MFMTIFLLHNWICNDTILGRLMLQDMKTEKGKERKETFKMTLHIGLPFQKQSPIRLYICKYAEL